MSCLRTVDRMSVRLIAGLFALVACCVAMQAQVPSVDFLGERFVKKFADAKNVADQFTEFGLEREPLKDWSKLVVFHYHLSQATIRSARPQILPSLRRSATSSPTSRCS